LTKVVVRLLPFQCTTELLLKFVPLTVSVTVLPPAVTLAGEMLPSVGGGLKTVKLTALVVLPDGYGLVTGTGNTPSASMSAAVICAVSCVLLTKVVVRQLPFHCTTAPLT